MSDIVLRGLLLPDRHQVSSTSNTNNNSVLKSLQLDESENQGAQSLRVLDSLKLSETSEGKGSVPIQLMSPDSIGTQSTPVKGSGKNSTFNALASLKPSSKPSSKPKNNPVLTGLSPSNNNYSATYSATSTTKYTQTSGNSKISGSYTTTTTGSINATNAVTSSDKVGSKIATAIEKIQTWDRKIGILNSELEKQKGGTVDASRLITRTSQMATAKKDAVISRDDAIKAYTDVMTEINKNFGSANSASFSQYKNAYLRMEAMFAAAEVKDKSLMDKTKDFLKGVMTPENFNKALNYFNPFN